MVISNSMIYSGVFGNLRVTKKAYRPIRFFKCEKMLPKEAGYRNPKFLIIKPHTGQFDSDDSGH